MDIAETATFSLSAIAEGIEFASDTLFYYANVQTGAVYVDDYDFSLSEEDDSVDFESGEWVSLPGRYERHDWNIMRDFACELGGAAGEDLLDAIHGSGAFRAFRNTVERQGTLQSWYAYRDERMAQMAIEWLEKNHLAWVDDRHENSKRDWRALLPASLTTELELSVLGYRLSVCKYAEVPVGLLEGRFCCIMRTDDEISVVCETSKAPKDAISREDGWRALKVEGPLDLTLAGVMARISSALADADVPLFALSTFDTDYILVKHKKLKTAIAALREEECKVNEPGRGKGD